MVKVNYGMLIWKMVVHLYWYMRTSQALTRPDNTTKYQLPERINIFKLQGFLYLFLFLLSFKFHDSYQLLVIFSNES